MFLKRWWVPKGIEHEDAQSPEFDYTGYWSGMMFLKEQSSFNQKIAPR